MKYSVIGIVGLLTTFVQAANAVREDSLAVNLNEVVVTRGLREQQFVHTLPVSSTVLSGRQLIDLDATDLQSMSLFVPNLYAPEYGSKITSALYMRGVGTRMNTSAVGYYVDNVPFLDKSAFDQEWLDVDYVEVLRGPQATLYGRNSMGGLIHVHTRSPFAPERTMLEVSMGTYDLMRLRFLANRTVTDWLAFSASFIHAQQEGFVTNRHTGKSSGSEQSTGLQTRWSAKLSPRWNADLRVAFEVSDQQGYPYAPVKKDTFEVRYDGPSDYERRVLSTSLRIGSTGGRTQVASVTGYQRLEDALWLDQDFSPASIFTMEQRQEMHALTQEFVLKSEVNRIWNMSNGLFAAHKLLKTSSPVVFDSAGVVMLERNIQQGIPSTINTTVDITDPRFLNASDFEEDVNSIALYHQSKVDFPFLPGLSATAGMRVEWEHVALGYRSSAGYNYVYQMAYGPMSLTDQREIEALLDGSASQFNVHWAPKLSLQYEWDTQHRVYASISKGYQSGGYNVQLFSDLIQSELQAEMQDDMKSSISTKLAEAGAPASIIPRVVGSIPDGVHVEDVNKHIAYKPEYSWNYEVGVHLEPVSGKLSMDAAVFYIQTKDRQIARFSPNGFGRMMSNASGSFSRGFEVSIQARPMTGMHLQAGYGYTDARFSDYTDSVRSINGYDAVHYKGKKVPMVPAHSVNVGLSHTFRLNSPVLDGLTLAAQYAGTGPLYWTEANDVKQNFYGVVNGRVSLIKERVRLDVWAKNVLDARYRTFYFESMGTPLAQQSAPRQVGLTLSFVW
ncbi:MAG TPA: TonB-dependent receptor [Bacteroidales bacterium]|nr:TonB-dependent receptor [Bacteroidales bacterium]